ncbi:FliM/FliN family flagellar motor switch protein [Paracoccus aminophilus]|uniref:Flagellar motor switch protein FliN n=1 Tax=Paracoccus aminophilus JCM 7686 TaxID=1367847 RepID=S5XJS7_PARAH|nr:FliM/FliN family flagellar motor C-terminal domain-containing protein [Paracoccus aminophilus]AGT07444.1 flagellar motor switch protein FliN [Paracoccus aminophilus JCM 7686]
MSEVTGLIATDHIQVELTVRLGATRLTVAEISRLRPDDVVALDQDMTQGVELCIGEKIIARGELTTMEGAEDRLCVRILGPAENG